MERYRKTQRAGSARAFEPRSLFSQWLRTNAGGCRGFLQHAFQHRVLVTGEGRPYRLSERSLRNQASCLSAVTGSKLAARLAGSQAANKATIESTKTTPAS